MRSLSIRIALASLLTVLLSFGAFMAIGRSLMGGPGGQMFRTSYTRQMEEAIAAYERGGNTALAEFVDRLSRESNRQYYVTDANGQELLTRQDQSQLLAAVPDGSRLPQSVGDRYVYVRASADGRYRMIVVGDPLFTMWSFVPFYLLVLAAVVSVSWFVAISIASPLRALAAAADRFGRGDLAARVSYRGRNEIGTVASSFNTMADRIESLLTAERRLLQDVSHELRSPLARLNLSAELARTTGDRNAAVDRIQRDLDRLGILVGELLEVTRVEGDPAARRVHAVSVETLVDEVAQACSIDAHAQRRRVVVAGVAPRPVSGDPELLRRAVENVLRNALQHTPEGTDVNVTLAENGPVTTVSIRDHGPGVPDGDLPRIFDAFYRVDPSRNSNTGGIGLGLAIAQRAVHLHHGSIVAEHASPGLRITMSFPNDA